MLDPTLLYCFGCNTPSPKKHYRFEPISCSFYSGMYCTTFLPEPNQTRTIYDNDVYSKHLKHPRSLDRMSLRNPSNSRALIHELVVHFSYSVGRLLLGVFGAADLHVETVY